MLDNPELLSQTNIARFGPEHLNSFLSAVLPLEFVNALEVAWRPEARSRGPGKYANCAIYTYRCETSSPLLYHFPNTAIPDGQWINLLWSYLTNPRSLASFKTQQQSQRRGVRSLGGMSNKLGEGPSASAPVIITLVDIAQLCGRWPILPVFVDKSLMPMLVRLDADLPLLHLTQANIPVSTNCSTQNSLSKTLNLLIATSFRVSYDDDRH